MYNEIYQDAMFEVVMYSCSLYAVKLRANDRNRCVLLNGNRIVMVS